MSPRNSGDPPSTMVPLEQMQAAVAAAEGCAMKRNEIWAGINAKIGGAQGYAKQLFIWGVGLFLFIFAGMGWYMANANASMTQSMSEETKAIRTKDEKQDDKISAIELKMVKEVAEINTKMSDMTATVRDFIMRQQANDQSKASPKQ